jgi:hypothetical protein
MSIVTAVCSPEILLPAAVVVGVTAISVGLFVGTELSERKKNNRLTEWKQEADADD